MKFLSITTLKDSFSMVPLPVQRHLIEASLAWVEEHKKAGEILEAYETAEGSVVICEHPSVEEFMQRIASIPMGGFMNFKVYPLADFRVSMQAYIEAIKQAEKFSQNV